MSSRKVRVRFAPSPTGPLHIGGVRTALYNYLFARQNNGDFLLRIEDTDQTRFVPGAEDYIKEALQWLGLKYDEGPDVGGTSGPYRQSERQEMYRQYADMLIASEHAYYAFDTPEELDAMRERMKKAGVPSPKYDQISREYMKNSLTLPTDEVQERINRGDQYVIRIKTPRKEEVRLNDMIRGWVVVQSAQMDDKVLFKSDGMPTYHLANVVDDYLMNITHVIRGEEWLPSAPLHVLLYKYLGWEDVMPRFAHLPLILKPDGNGKLSKRDGAKGGFPVFPLNWNDPETGETFAGYRESGYLPEATLNILALLGWSSSDNKEIYSREELIQSFSIEKVGKSGAKFDPEKAKWINQQHLRQMDDAALAEQFMPELQEKGVNADSDYVKKVCKLVNEKASFSSEFWSLGHYFFNRPESYDDAVISKRWDDKAANFFTKLAERFEEIGDFSAERIEEDFKATAEMEGMKPGQVMQLFRVLISGEAAGPGLMEIAETLGKDEVVARLRLGLEKLS